MAQNETAEWITAVATGATALLTGTGGLAAWLALRREQRRELPVIERSVEWRAGYLLVSLTVRNRLPETITLDRIDLRKPKLATITLGHSPTTDGYGNTGPPLRGGEDFLLVGYSVRPYGSSPSQISTGDTGHFQFAIWPHPSWVAGGVVMVLRISSKAETIRNRRIVIKSKVAADPAKQAAEKASNRA